MQIFNCKSAYALYEGQELTLNAFKSGIFSIKATQGEELKILARKQMLRRLPIALAQMQAVNTSENQLNEICQKVYSLESIQKELLKKCIINEFNKKYDTKWITIFTNFENSETSEPHRFT